MSRGVDQENHDPTFEIVYLKKILEHLYSIYVAKVIGREIVFQERQLNGEMMTRLSREPLQKCVSS